MMSVTVTQMDTPPQQPSEVQTNIIAAVGGQLAATPLYAKRNIVTNCVAGAAVIIQLLPCGWMQVMNRCGTGQALTVFPIVNMKIEGNAPNVPVEIADGDQITFVWDGSVKWLVS